MINWIPTNINSLWPFLGGLHLTRTHSIKGGWPSRNFCRTKKHHGEYATMFHHENIPMFFSNIYILTPHPCEKWDILPPTQNLCVFFVRHVRVITLILNKNVVIYILGPLKTSRKNAQKKGVEDLDPPGVLPLSHLTLCFRFFWGTKKPKISQQYYTPWKLTAGYPKWWFGKGGSGFKCGHFWYLC